MKAIITLDQIELRQLVREEILRRFPSATVQEINFCHDNTNGETETTSDVIVLLNGEPRSFCQRD